MNSAFVVPAQVLLKSVAACSRVFKSLTPNEDSSPSALRVSNVAWTGASAAFVIWSPTTATPIPVFVMLPSPCSIFWSLETEPPTPACTLDNGEVRLSTMDMIKDSLNTLSNPILPLLCYSSGKALTTPRCIMALSSSWIYRAIAR